MTVIDISRYADLQAAKDEKLAEINAAAEQSLADVKRQYPSSEIASWPQQQREAEAWQADSSAATPLLDHIASARGVSKQVAANKVLANAKIYRAQAGAAFGKRQALRDQIDAATTVREVLAIEW